jgi:hypothetical protein
MAQSNNPEGINQWTSLGGKFKAAAASAKSKISSIAGRAKKSAKAGIAKVRNRASDAVDNAKDAYRGERIRANSFHGPSKFEKEKGKARRVGQAAARVVDKAESAAYNTFNAVEKGVKKTNRVVNKVGDKAKSAAKSATKSLVSGANKVRANPLVPTKVGQAANRAANTVAKATGQDAGTKLRAGNATGNKVLAANKAKRDNAAPAAKKAIATAKAKSSPVVDKVKSAAKKVSTQWNSQKSKRVSNRVS